MENRLSLFIFLKNVKAKVIVKNFLNIFMNLKNNLIQYVF